jgi:dTDP-4-dehydrorhamnose 3,5-epimerase
MKIKTTKFDGLVLIEPDVFGDHRGFFIETYQTSRYRDAGIQIDFIQDNVSFSVGRTLRGLHFQNPNPQAKLVQVLKGEIFDVAVDIRYGSPTFGQWEGILLSAENHHQIYIPEGFAHGFCVLSDGALFSYKCSDIYVPESEGGICWNDPDINIEWPVENPILSDRDQTYPRLKDMDIQKLPIL